VIDALSDGLNEAVSTVVEQAVQKVVETVLTEVLTNPELRQVLAAAAQPVPPTPPMTPIAVPEAPQPTTQTWVQWLLGTVQAAWDWVADKARQAALVDALAGQCGRTVRTWAGNAGMLAVLLLWWLNQYRMQVLIAAGVGVGMGAACYLAGPLVASTVSGFAATLIAGVLGVLRRGWADLTGEPDGA
jgi:hypothetical protein